MLMKEFIVQCLISLGTGLVTGLIFAWIKLPIPAPPAIPAVFGILGITVGYLLFQKLFGV
jgi:XapX domain-containing protein